MPTQPNKEKTLHDKLLRLYDNKHITLDQWLMIEYILRNHNGA